MEAKVLRHWSDQEFIKTFNQEDSKYKTVESVSFNTRNLDEQLPMFVLSQVKVRQMIIKQGFPARFALPNINLAFTAL